MLDDGAFLLILLALVIVLGWMLYRLIACNTNELEWSDLVATRGKLNSYKIGFWIGAIVGTWVVIQQTYKGGPDIGIFGIYMAFLTGAPVAMAAIGRTGAAPQPQSRKVDNPD